MTDELFVVTDVDGETRWAYTTKKAADKADDTPKSHAASFFLESAKINRGKQK